MFLLFFVSLFWILPSWRSETCLSTRDQQILLTIVKFHFFFYTDTVGITIERQERACCATTGTNCDDDNDEHWGIVPVAHFCSGASLGCHSLALLSLTVFLQLAFGIDVGDAVGLDISIGLDNGCDFCYHLRFSMAKCTQQW